MESNVLLLCVSLIIPVFFVIYGAVLYKKDVPFLSPYGFITVMTKLGPEVWEFGNKKMGIRLIILGSAEIIICVLMILSFRQHRTTIVRQMRLLSFAKHADFSSDCPNLPQ